MSVIDKIRAKAAADVKHVVLAEGTEPRNKKILDQVKEVTHTDMVTILKNLDRELVKGALSGARFKEYFFANCKCDKIAEAVKEVLA